MYIIKSTSLQLLKLVYLDIFYFKFLISILFKTHTTYITSQKSMVSKFFNNFVKSQPISQILSPLERGLYFQKMHMKIFLPHVNYVASLTCKMQTFESDIFYFCCSLHPVSCFIFYVMEPRAHSLHISHISAHYLSHHGTTCT